MANKKRKKKDNEQDIDGIESINKSFNNNLLGLQAFVDNLEPVAQKYDASLADKVDEIFGSALQVIGIDIAELLKKSSGGEKPKEIQKIVKETLAGKELNKEQLHKFLKTLLPAIKVMPQSQLDLLYTSSFVMLICYFDFLVSDLIHYYYRIYPDSLSTKEMTLKLNELKSCGDIGEAIDYLVSKEIDRVLFESLKVQKKYFMETLHIDVRDKIIDWIRLEEATERRHIIVHNNGIINRRYIRNLDPSLLPEGGLKEGKKIYVTKQYFNDAFNEILIAGIILIQCCWRKWAKDKLDAADKALINLEMVGALQKEKWMVSERLGLFSKECEMYDDSSRLTMDINYCQSLKWQNKDAEFKNELSKFDISTLSPKYQLAICALKSDKKGFYKYLSNAISVDGLKEEDFMTWPLFREMRLEPEYQTKIKSILESLPKNDGE